MTTVDEIREWYEEMASNHAGVTGFVASDDFADKSLEYIKFLLAAYDEQAEQSGTITFICSSCKAIAEDNVNDIEDGTVLTCKKCGAETVVLLQGVDKYKTITELKAANDRPREALGYIISEGHNDDCLFCGLKDKRVTEAVFKDFPLGQRVEVVSGCVDHYFFWNETGVVTKNNGKYLGVIVRFDKPRIFKDNFVQDKFNFNPEDLKPIPKIDDEFCEECAQPLTDNTERELNKLRTQLAIAVKGLDGVKKYNFLPKNCNKMVDKALADIEAVKQ